MLPVVAAGHMAPNQATPSAPPKRQKENKKGQKEIYQKGQKDSYKKMTKDNLQKNGIYKKRTKNMLTLRWFL